MNKHIETTERKIFDFKTTVRGLEFKFSITAENKEKAKEILQAGLKEILEELKIKE